MLDLIVGAPDDELKSSPADFADILPSGNVSLPIREVIFGVQGYCATDEGR